MISDARDYLMLQPWFVVFQGAAIAVVVLCVNLCDDALRTLVQPSGRHLTQLRSAKELMLTES